MSKTKHAPLPWRVGSNGTDYCVFAGDEFVAHCDNSDNGDGTETDRATAAFIVRAANSHDALVAELRIALLFVEDELQHRRASGLPDDDEYLKVPSDILERIDAALKLAESGQ